MPYINFHFWKKKFQELKKVMTVFSIFKKMFPKIEKLMCALRAHINRTHIYYSLNEVIRGDKRNWLNQMDYQMQTFGDFWSLNFFERVPTFSSIQSYFFSLLHIPIHRSQILYIKLLALSHLYVQYDFFFFF